MRCNVCFDLMPCRRHNKPKPYANRTVKYAGGSGWQKIRARIFLRDNYVCLLRLEGCTGQAQVVDHIRNRARGGSDDDSNLASACKNCNEVKRRTEVKIGRGKSR